MEPLPFTTEGVDNMTMAEYLKTARMTEQERDEWNTRYGTPETVLPFPAADSYDAHSHHAEYGGARH